MEAVLWNPSQPYTFVNTRPTQPKALRIYECHVGIASVDYWVANYDNFRVNVLPRIKDLGAYNETLSPMGSVLTFPI